MKLPKARTGGIIENDLGNELMIYDLRIDKAYNLNETSKIVYLACNGQTSFDELKSKYKFTDDLIHLALAELKANNLLENYESTHFAGLSRREAVKRVGLASVIALPLISSLSAPTSAQAASGAPSCTDGIRNGSESDVDCGGSCATKCGPGRSCFVASDCTSNVCTGGICQAPTCSDGIRNGTETDTDCGGGTCPRCASGRSCFINADCVSNSCIGGVCS